MVYANEERDDERFAGVREHQHVWSGPDYDADRYSIEAYPFRCLGCGVVSHDRATICYDCSPQVII